MFELKTILGLFSEIHHHGEHIPLHVYVTWATKPSPSVFETGALSTELNIQLTVLESAEKYTPACQYTSICT